MRNLKQQGYTLNNTSEGGSVEVWSKNTPSGRPVYAIIWRDYSTPRDKYGTPTVKAAPELDEGRVAKLYQALTKQETERLESNKIAGAWGLK